MYNLYFLTNGNEPKLQGRFDTEAEAEKHMEYLIDTKSKIKCWYIRKLQRDGYWWYDYGPYNEFYTIKEVE